MSRRMTRLLSVGLAGLFLAAAPVGAQSPLTEASLVGRVDRVFEAWDRRDSPGCAIAVGQRGRLLLTRTYGMANLEHDVPIRPDTIFEAGSVAKQFTAAAITLLVLDGKLSFDDPVGKYIPELPEFGSGILVRHLLTHTSGLRSQWPLLTLAGRPPGQAVHTIGEILDLVSRQRRLNFPPGEEFLYNNTAFTLLSVVVARVSGESFQDFCDRRLFKPIGMAATEWRTDFTKIVKKRATAYTLGRDGAFHAEASFTNVVGNGGLLTTVGDLFRWNENLDNPRIGGRAMAEALQTRARLNDGFEIVYGKGLYVDEFRGLRMVHHGGSTAGYRAFVARYPDERTSISILCNSGSITPESLAQQVAAIMLEGRLSAPAIAPPVSVTEDELKSRAGLYRDSRTDAVLRIAFANGRLNADRTELTPIGPSRFRNASGSTEYVFEPGENGGPMRLRETERGSKPIVWVATPAVTPTTSQLAEYVGDYYSDELQVTYIARLDKERLVIRHRPEPGVLVDPLYADAFDVGAGRVVRFTRDQAGQVDGFEVFAGRVRHLRFEKRREGCGTPRRLW